MTARQRRSRLGNTGVVVLMAALSLSLLAGCSTTSAGSSSSSLVPKDDVGTLKNDVPAKWADGITAATQADIAPLTYTNDSGDVVGFDQDLLSALSDVLGVKIKVAPVTFENLILGLDSGKYDFVADTTIKKERLAKYDMLSYMTSSYSVETLKSAKSIGTSDTSICGMKLGVVTGEVISDFVTSTIDPKCTSAGLQAVNLTEYKDFSSASLAVNSESIQGMIIDTMTFGYFQTKGAGKAFKFNGPTGINSSNSGYSFLKAQDGKLATVVAKAVDVLVKDGTYAKLLKKYGLTKAGVSKSVLNPPANI